jgi:PEGA domain
MHRVIAIVSGGLALAACTSLNLDFLKPGPVLETVRFESQPPGAEAKVSNGQTCRTPCALALPAGGPYTVTYSLSGYQPATEQIELVSMGDNSSRLEPNPVLIDLTPAPPPPPAKRKPAAKKRTAKPVAKRPAPKPATGNAAPPPPPPPAATSPWPATPPQQR